MFSSGKEQKKPDDSRHSLQTSSIDSLSIEQKQVFANNVSPMDKLNYFLCPKKSVFSSLVRGEGAFWEQYLLTHDEFKIENASVKNSGRADILYKSGNLLYVYCGGGKGSYTINIYLIDRNVTTFNLWIFFAMKCERYVLPSNVNVLPFDHSSMDFYSTRVSSSIEKFSDTLKGVANQIASDLWDVSIGKPVDPEELTKTVIRFNRKVKMAFDSVGSSMKEDMIVYDWTVLSEKQLPEVKPSPVKKVLYPTRFFKEGYDVEKRQQIKNLFTAFIDKVKRTDGFHVFVQDRGLTRGPELTFATDHDAVMDDIIRLGKAHNILSMKFSCGLDDGHPANRTGFSCYEMDEDIEKLRRFLDDVSTLLNAKQEVTLEEGSRRSCLTS